MLTDIPFQLQIAGTICPVSTFRAPIPNVLKDNLQRNLKMSPDPSNQLSRQQGKTCTSWTTILRWIESLAKMHDKNVRDSRRFHDAITINFIAILSK